MNSRFVICMLVLLILSCSKDEKKILVKPAYIPKEINNVQSFDLLSVTALLGRWELLNSDGKRDNSKGYIVFMQNRNDINVDFYYQNRSLKCKLQIDTKYYLIDENGAKYKISRVRSSLKQENNGISLSLDDISIGVFQRDDVLEKVQSD
jgi:hypothetical protein